MCQGAACLANIASLSSGADNQVYDVGRFACQPGLWVEGGTQWGGNALCERHMSTGAAPGGPAGGCSRAHKWWLFQEYADLLRPAADGYVALPL